MQNPADISVRPGHPFADFLRGAEQFYLGDERRAISHRLLDSFRAYSNRLHADGEHLEYCNLQDTWNSYVLMEFASFLPALPEHRDRVLGLGSFRGALEMALADHFREVVAVDLENFLPAWRPANVVFQRANVDSADWVLPDGPFNFCFMVEILEHLLWSPLPLLNWVARNCHALVITTPDHDEWPPMAPLPYIRHGDYRNIPPASPGAPSNPRPMYHCKQYRQHEFIDLLHTAGFRVLRMARIGLDSKQMMAICSSKIFNPANPGAHP